MFLAKDGVNYYETSFCDGSDATIVANRYCNVPMSVFMQLPYLLIQGDAIVAQASAMNEIGWSPESNPNTIGSNVETIPGQPMTAPTMVSQSPTSISVFMPDVSGLLTGGSAITSYNL